jgi:hypothetical protein
MITEGAPLVFEVQWSSTIHRENAANWYTASKWDNEVDAVIALGREVENNPELPHRIVRTETTELFLIKGVRA